MSGGFYAIEADASLGALAETAPPVSWIVGATERRVEGAVVKARRIGHPGDERVLVSRDAKGELALHFDIEKTSDEILLERYHEGLAPTLEMRLPFNYSRLPSWVKKIGRAVSPSTKVLPKAKDFPGRAPAFVLEWLGDLAISTNAPAPSRPRRVTWPDGHRAALVVTYDVDTDWLLRNDRWLERFCDLEDRHGMRGAYYCVPMWCRSRAAKRGLQRLVARGREIGVHGYNHDAKWPLLEGRAFEKRVERVKAFAGDWGMRGFRSEWLWRTPRFLETLAQLFDYDSSVPNTFDAYTKSGNGCATCFPYTTDGGLLEIPLTLPMDEWRHYDGSSVGAHFDRLVTIAKQIIERGGVVVFALHPQPHQAANEETITAYEKALGEVASLPNLWKTRPVDLARWLT